MHATLQSWLDLLCQMLPRVSAGALYPAADPGEIPSWPRDEAVPDEFRTASSMAAEQKAPVIVNKEHHLLVAYPLTINGDHFGVVTLNLEASSDQQAIIMQLLDWSRSWLELILGNQAQAPRAGDDGSLVFIHKLLEMDDFEAATTSLVTFLADDLGCERVSLGIQGRDGVAMAALSHQVQFDARINLVGMMQSAMAEALREDSVISFEPQKSNDWVAHELLAKELPNLCLTSLPLHKGKEPVGALLLERKTPLSTTEIDHLELVASVLGHVVAQLLVQQQSLMKKGQMLIVQKLNSLMGPRASLNRLVTVALLILGALLVFVRGDYTVTANATLEGFTQQAIVAPYNGFIAQANARAGDIVEAEQVLGRMDDRDLVLELQRVASEEEELTRQYRQALATLNQSESRITKARVDEANARWSLLKRRLDQVELRTPITGIIITGDLSRSIGAPVEKGDLLFEIAPLKAYRIVLQIDESDIDEIVVGQQGEVILTSHPTRKIPFIVENIASVLTSEQDLGVVFRTEGALTGDYEFLRPGMEGVARVSIGQRSIGWIIFHDAIDWLYLIAWRWSP